MDIGDQARAFENNQRFMVGYQGGFRMGCKRSFIELEDMIVESLKSFPKKDWEISERLNIDFYSVKRRLARLRERGAVVKVNELWHWLPPEKRTICDNND